MKSVRPLKEDRNDDDEIDTEDETIIELEIPKLDEIRLPRHISNYGRMPYPELGNRFFRITGSGS